MTRPLGALAAAACLLAAAGGLARAQDYRVTITIGSQPVAQDVDGRGYARYYLNYAAHAVESYREFKGQETGAQLFGSFDALAPWRETTDQRRHAEERLAAQGWRFAGGHSGPLLCQPDDLACVLRPIPVKGLAYQFWKRRDCRNIAIVFRGTDPTSSSDWYSNFRFVTRVLPFADEYDQVRQSIKKIVADARTATGCGKAKIIAVGHSLGGGLAQLAAYSYDDIKRVYAFNSSPVTAFYDIDQATRQRSTKDLVIDRVYEKGEILALPRRITEWFVRPSACDPQMRTAEFNTVAGFSLGADPISQHNVERLWGGLFDFATKATRRLKLPGYTGDKPVGCDVKTAKAQDGRGAKIERTKFAKRHGKKARVALEAGHGR